MEKQSINLSIIYSANSRNSNDAEFLHYLSLSGKIVIQKKNQERLIGCTQEKAKEQRPKQGSTQ